MASKRRDSELLCAGARRLVPEAWRKWPLFDNIFRLKGVPVITVQLRYDGWITELQDQSKMQDLSHVSPPLPEQTQTHEFSMAVLQCEPLVRPSHLWSHRASEQGQVSSVDCQCGEELQSVWFS